jgi:hypothetical protein
MGGGGGGGRYVRPWSSSEQQKIDQAQERERQRLQGSVNSLLNDLLARFNSRDIDATKNKLEELSNILGEKIEIDQILFGGSVAKHTEVDGISDIDALVVLDRSDLRGKSPQEMLNFFYKALNSNLPRAKVDTISQGRLAVTVKYKDGTEIQLLPALRSRDKIEIAGSSGKIWNDINPRIFQRKLTKSNNKMNNSLVPTIKLFKSINSGLPKQKQLTGYHIESMAVEAVKNYDGPKLPRALLSHLIGYAAERVLRPIQDKTGQARIVDAYIGKADSFERRNVSQT